MQKELCGCHLPYLSTCSVVVITAVSHTAGPQFDPGQVQLCVYLVMTLYFVRDNAVLNPTQSNFV